MSEIIRYKCPRGCKCYTRAGGDSGETPRCPNCDHRMIPAEDETSEGKMFPPIGMQKCGKCGGGITGNQGHTCPPVSELKACPGCNKFPHEVRRPPNVDFHEYAVCKTIGCKYFGSIFGISYWNERPEIVAAERDALRAELEAAITDRTKMADERDAAVDLVERWSNFEHLTFVGTGDFSPNVKDRIKGTKLIKLKDDSEVFLQKYKSTADAKQ